MLHRYYIAETLLGQMDESTKDQQTQSAQNIKQP